MACWPRGCKEPGVAMEHDQDRKAASRLLQFRNLLRRFHRDRSGSYVVIVGLSAPVLVGLVGLGTEDGLWLYTHQSLQSATDAAACSAAQAYSVSTGLPLLGPGPNVVAEANSIAASYGFTNGQDNVTVTVNRPPTSGPMTGA